MSGTTEKSEWKKEVTTVQNKRYIGFSDYFADDIRRDILFFNPQETSIEWMLPDCTKDPAPIEFSEFRFWNRFDNEYEINLVDASEHRLINGMKVLDGVVHNFRAPDLTDLDKQVLELAKKYNVPLIAIINNKNTVEALCRNIEKVSGRSVLQLSALEESSAGNREAYAKVVETAAEVDPVIMEEYLAENLPDREVLFQSLRCNVIAGKIIPALCEKKDMETLLNAIIDFLPSPVDRRKEHTGFNPGTNEPEIRSCDEKAPFSALVLSKTSYGRFFMLRVCSGKAVRGMTVYNPRTQKTIRFENFVKFKKLSRKDINEAPVGEIVGVSMPLEADIVPGDTLCDEKAPILYNPLPPPLEPFISFEIETGSADRKEVIRQLDAILLRREEAEIPFTVSEKHGQIIVSGVNEDILESSIRELKAVFQSKISIGDLKIIYRKKFTKSGTAEAEFIRKTCKRISCELKVSPGENKTGITIINKVSNATIPENIIGAISNGIRKAAGEGIFADNPLTASVIEILNAAYDQESSEKAYQELGAMALYAVAEKAEISLLEPVAKVKITAPEDCFTDIIPDITARRGNISDIRASGGRASVTAEIPYAEIIGTFSGALRNISKGNATFSISPEDWDTVKKI